MASMQNIDSYTHTRGESIYLDDIPLQQGTLFGAVYGSPVAHGKILSLDISAAAAMPGVVRIFTHHDIPGENQIGGIIRMDQHRVFRVQTKQTGGADRIRVLQGRLVADQLQRPLGGRVDLADRRAVGE